MEDFIFVFLYKGKLFSTGNGAVAPNVPLSYATDTAQNYIPLSHPHYIHHTKHVQKVDKPMIYVMIGSETDVRELM